MAFDAGTILGHMRIDNSGFTRGMMSAQSIAQAFGPTVTAFITNPILGAVEAGKKLFALHAEQARSEARLAAVVKATGMAAGYTAEQLAKQAAELQELNGLGDEQIMKGQAILLTFKGIQGVQFDRTIQSAMDMAAVMGTDLNGSAVQLGKALNDPIKNLSALSRAGVQFNAEQTRMIKNLANSGRLAEAQGVILDELESQFGGAAKSVAEADGGWTKFLNTLGDLGELIGGFLAPALSSLSTILKPLLERLMPVAEILGKIIEMSVKWSPLGLISKLVKGEGVGVGDYGADLKRLGSDINVIMHPDDSADRVAKKISPAIARTGRRVQQRVEADTRRRVELDRYSDGMVLR